MAILLPLSLGAERRPYLKLDSRMEHGGSCIWRMIRADEAHATGAQLSSTGFSDGDWMEAIVPGTVLGSLVRNEVYPEPYYGQNNKLSKGLIPDLAHVGHEFYTYWFRTETVIPAQFKGRRIWLEPEGINYRAQLWVNGRLADSWAGMFQSRPVDITDYVTPGETAAIALLVQPVDFPGTTMPKYWGAVGEWHNGGDGWIGQNVTQLMTVGWDFTYEDGIRDRNTGIWKSIRLYASGPAQLRAPMVKSALNAPLYDLARETLSVEVHNPGLEPFEGIVSARIPEAGITLSQKVKLERGMNREVVFSPEDYPALVISQPRLWWPRFKGRQPLYSLELTLHDKNGQESDRISTRFGIREVVTSRETPDRSKLFIINGHPTFVRGSNWIPEAMLRTSDSRTETELLYTAQSGINLLRLWGGGIAESDRWYELCDSLGIMVWQEFWMTGDTRHPIDPALYLANVENTVKRIRNHPSIVFYVSSNESTAVSGAEELLSRLDGTRPYQMQSECDGIHDGSPYKQVNPMRHYENTASERGSRVDGFNPEYGAPTLPIVESLREMMPPEDLWPINRETWNYMDGNGFHLMTTLYDQMVRAYGEPADIEGYARQGQLVGAMNSKSIWEVWNRNKLGYGDSWCSGLLFWYHNSPNMQVCARMWDWNLEPTASLFHTMHSLEPLHVQFDYLTNRVSVVNDFLTPRKDLRVQALVFDFDSRCVWRSVVPVDVPADGVADDVMTIRFPKNISQIHFISLKLIDRDDHVVSDNFYWRSKDPYKGAQSVTGPCTSGFRNMSRLKPARPEVNVQRLSDADGLHRWKVSIGNGSGRIAFFCQLLLTRTDGSAVHGTHYSDNFITLLPGESKVIEVSTPVSAGDDFLFKFNEALQPTRVYSSTTLMSL